MPIHSLVEQTPSEKHKKFIKISAIIWVSCVLCVCAVIGYVVGIRKELFNTAPTAFMYLLLGFVLVGCISFFVGILSIILLSLHNKTQKKKNVILFIFNVISILSILPLYLFITVLNPKAIIGTIKEIRAKGIKTTIHFKNVLLKIFLLCIICFVFFPMWVWGYLIAGTIAIHALGYQKEGINVSGTGSMFPTFPKGQGKDSKELAKEIVGTPGMLPYPNGFVIGGRRFFGYQIGRGDIVVVRNEKIQNINEQMYGESSGWVKRIIGLPGNQLEIRDGIVYIDNEPLKEQYTAKPHSTFGETYLAECKKVVVPNDSIFVMGDNRKGSGDSREIGFIKISDINHILPLKSQIGILDKTWRDTSKDFDAASKITLDKEKYLQLLNQKRKEAGVQEIKYQPKLEVSAKKRGETIIKYNDFSFEATKSGYTMGKAMSDANYFNIVYGEAPTQGYFEADELIDNQFQFPEYKKFFIEKTYQEVGIAEVEGEINGCPIQVIVQHFAGYVPPNYKKEDIESWKTNTSRLLEIQPSWSRLKDSGNFYQKNKRDVDRINEIISMRIANNSAIIARMEANQWFSAAENKMIDQDKALFDEQETIAKRLNSQ